MLYHNEVLQKGADRVRVSHNNPKFAVLPSVDLIVVDEVDAVMPANNIHAPGNKLLK